MRMTAFNGSPRGADGNTNRILAPLLAGAREAGAHVDLVQLVDLDIRHCTGCFSCWKINPGVCVLPDDMAPLLDMFMQSDLVVLASPLYTDSVTSIMKKFLERLLPLVKPTFEFVDGETRHVRRYEKYPDFVVVSNCGYPEYSQFQVVSLLFERLARELDVDVRLELYRSMGELLKVDHLLLKPVLKRYSGRVRKLGAMLVSGKPIPERMMRQVNAPLISENMYRNKANEQWPEQ